MTIPVVHHPAYVARLPADHRFPMAKFKLLVECLRERGHVHEASLMRPTPAPREMLALAHAPSYVEAVLQGSLTSAQERRLGLPWSPALALRSQSATAGTTLTARLALRHGVACNTAGGSHHAFADFGSGFCVFNDVVVAIRVLQAEGLIKRALVIDLDVHQGDGTAAMTEDDPSIVTLSLHCRANFPAIKRKSDMDIALDPGLTGEAYLQILEATLPAMLERARPDLVFYNAGVDPHGRDRLGKLDLRDEDLFERDRYVIAACLARNTAVACVIGGGYARDAREIAQRHSLLFEAANLLARGL